MFGVKNARTCLPKTGPGAAYDNAFLTKYTIGCAMKSWVTSRAGKMILEVGGLGLGGRVVLDSDFSG